MKVLEKKQEMGSDYILGDMMKSDKVYNKGSFSESEGAERNSSVVL